MENENKKGRKKKEIGYDSVFAKRLRVLMEENKTTQPQLAEAVGVSRQAVGQWKDGNTVPDILDFQKIADFYNVSTDFLLGRAENPLNETDIKEHHFYKKLSAEAIENLETIFDIDLGVPDSNGFLISVPLAETCNSFFSSPLFFEFISNLADLSARSKQQIKSCGFSLGKAQLTCKALNILRPTFDKLIEYIDVSSCDDLTYRELFRKLKSKGELSSDILVKSLNDDKDCDLFRYRIISLVDKINDFFDYRNIITDTEEEKERFLKLLRITEDEVRKLDKEMKELFKREAGD